MSEKFNVKQHKYIEAFKCIGGACEDSCCIGWDVGVDIQTFSFLESKEDHPLTELISQTMFENEHCFDDAVNFGNIALNDKKECSFLNDDKLCKLQLAFGEEGISNVCNSFPRVINYIDEKMEKSLSMACPEAARMLLLKDEHPVFDELETTLPHLLVLHTAETAHPENKGTFVEYLQELREFSMWTIRQEGKISSKLHVLGLFLKEVEASEPKEIPTLIEKYTSKFSQFLEEEGTTPEHYQVGLDLLSLMNVESEVDSPRFAHYYNTCKSGLGAKKRKNKYERLLQNQVGEFLTSNPFMIENYLLNDMYQTVFPFTERDSMTMSYKMLTAKVALLELLLCGVVNSGLTLDKSLVVDMLQVFTKTVEHHYSYLLRIKDVVTKEDIDLAWLIK